MSEYTLIAPEIMMAAGAMLLLMFGAYGGGDEKSDLIHWASVLLMLVVGAWVVTGSPGGEVAFNGAFVNDGFARFGKVVVLFSSAAILALGHRYLTRRGLMRYEFPLLVVLATLGMMIMVSAGDLMSLYMGLELQSLALYVVAAFNRDSVRSTEAGLKYFVLGALSSGLLLYGASLVYGYTGTTRFEGIAEVVSAEGVSLGVTFGLVFVCAGLAFKVSAVPFHMWTPDVYEGSPTNVTALFATAPKAAAAVLIARVLFGAFADAVPAWQQILVFVSVASMFLGAVAAIGQTNIKRLMAYSSIGHMGFAMVGLAAGTQAGAESLLTYVAIYVVMNIGVFAFIMCMERDGKPVAQIADLAGLAAERPAQAMGVAALMMSLAGLPPLVGFFAKFFVFKAAVDAGLTALVVAGVVASAIGAYYYLNIVRVMYLDQATRPMTGRVPALHGLALGVSAALMAGGWLPFLSGLGLTEVASAAAATLVP